MALLGKLIGYVEISSHGDVFHNLWRHQPNDITSMCPTKIHGCDLLDGERGTVGSTIRWIYTHDGKKKASTQIIEAVDETTHKIVFKLIGGELVEEIYKAFTIIFHVEPKGNTQLATWTFEFEKPNTNVPYPTSLMDYLCGVVKDMDDHTSDK